MQQLIAQLIKVSSINNNSFCHKYCLIWLFISVTHIKIYYFLDDTNGSKKRLESDESEISEELRIKYQTEYRRNKLDLSSGFTDLKAGKTDAYVREFIDRLKEKRDSTKSNSLNISDDKVEDPK